MKTQCEHCETEFDQKRSGQKLCGRECAVRWARKQRVTFGGHGRPPERRNCLACGAEFIAGGRGNKPRKQLLCSDECQKRARYRRGKQARAMTIAEAAYLAGIIDGEGSVIIHGRGKSIQLRLLITNTHQGVLEWATAVTGVGRVNSQYPARYSSIDGGPPVLRRPTYAWACNSDSAESVLKQIQPYMVIKSAQAALAIEVQRKLRDPSTKADLSWQEPARLQMKALNRWTYPPAGMVSS